jgi:1-aminocyclopropane-1-carboxylate deaminase
MKIAGHKRVQNFFKKVNSPIQPLLHPLFEEKGIEVYVKREDLLDVGISGNKFRKLHYNLVEAAKNGQEKLITFAGAYSNHLAAIAAAGYRFGFLVHAIIRGEEPARWSPTLQYANKLGVQLHFVSRSDYRERHSAGFQKSWLKKLGGGLVIPEGGTNCQALKGLEAMTDQRLLDLAPDFIAVASGTGGTAAGIIATPGLSAKVLSFPVLKGEFMKKEIETLLAKCGNSAKLSFDVLDGYHFGGYAKVPDLLMDFIHKFEMDFPILLDPVYTAKLFYGIFDLVSKDYFPVGSKLLLIHTGGLQGRAGFTSLQVPPSIFAIPQ